MPGRDRRPRTPRTAVHRQPLSYWESKRIDRRNDLRYAAAQALGEMGTGGPPALGDLLGDEDAEVQRAAAAAG